ncbi:MAG: allantoinase AllB, partial [Actinobacteria bacterium]|nr:allantoinase AllB [Actinomycetota bacterium]MSX74022.1 allantoinase AllB [Actinomycetota bacterium]MTA76601.1 allantoinase AllB [Actinomycetota bacterium]
MSYDLVIRAKRAVTAIGERPVAVAITNGKIVALLDFNAKVEAGQDYEVLGVLMPGVVDTHVHINEPGRTPWEGFATATRAAAAGGVTTVIDMPLNSIPPTVTPDALAIKKNVAESQCSVDVGFWGGSIPGNVSQLEPLLKAGVFGFKCFLLHSGVDEFPASSLDDLASALQVLAKHDGLMVVHAEDSVAIERSSKAASKKYSEFLASRPKGAENVAIAQLIEESRRTGARVHVLHLSSSDAIAMIASAQEDGVKISTETCPHYLSLNSDEIADGATQYKCCPPIRESANQDRLWQGLKSGIISMIVSDHSPCTPDLKLFEVGDFQAAWGGISSLQIGVPIIWTEGSKRGISLFDLATWMSSRPAELVGLTQKGAIDVGKDADMYLFDPDRTFTVDPLKLAHKNP